MYGASARKSVESFAPGGWKVIRWFASASRMPAAMASTMARCFGSSGRSPPSIQRMFHLSR